MLIKKTGTTTNGTTRESPAVRMTGIAGIALDRRQFLRRSGLAVGGVGAVLATGGGMVQKAQAQAATTAIKQVKTVCTHCSVGCTVMATVENGVWTRQEPGFDSPFSLGGHCAKGAAVRDHAIGERRLKYPMKLAGGQW
ncbi:MAG: twin-arginine translocation signal domain-containing protein, partial [Stellaceae bacterium]